ncbi:MAG: hypothetical protein RL748_374 [Pseudomonadota bacterium]|jgi:uncharacterized membrane protein YfcA
MDIGMGLVLMAMGLFGGFCAGLLGIGGGMILVPFITMFLAAQQVAPDVIVRMAIATSLATIMFTSASSVRAHHQHGAVLWPVVRLLVPGLLLGSWIGPWLGKQMNATALAVCFALFVAFSATQMLTGKKPAASRQLPGAPGMAAAGGVIGILAGLVGAGGGFISVPFMTACNVKIHNAVATSAALGFPIAFAGTLSNIYFGWNAPHLPAYSMGFVYLPGLLIISLASVCMAPLGARTSHRLPVATLKKVFALVLYALAAYMLWKAWMLK